jgi:ribosomal protein S27AE
MFCPNCGKSEQTADTFCRACGEFLADHSGRFFLMNRILGISHPEKQIGFTIFIDLVTAIVSGLLLFFLMGYFDGAYKKTGVAAPGIVYLVYLFLGLVAVWQFLSFIIGTSFKRKLDASKGNQLSSISSENKVLLSGPPPQSLPTVDQKNMMANTVTEATTKTLNKAPRN